MERDSRIFVAGHRGLAGSAIVRALRQSGYDNLILRTREQVDLTDAPSVDQLLQETSPDIVILAAAKVGGILANATSPADFIGDNLAIQLNVIRASHQHRVRKFVFLGSSCIYPKLAPQPIREEYILTGPLEPTNEWYAVAKISGIKLCQAYRQQHGFNAISLMPTNLYGPGDNFDPQASHVLPALIRKFHEAKVDRSPEVTIWGSGTPRREFLHVDDLASAVLFLAENYNSGEIVNVGTGEDLPISDLARLVGEVVGYSGNLVFDRSKPDGTPRKLLDVSRLRGMGWRHTIDLREGVLETYRWYLENGARLEPSSASLSHSR
jgi:GDP-L-fucose synthase